MTEPSSGHSLLKTLYDQALFRLQTIEEVSAQHRLIVEAQWHLEHKHKAEIDFCARLLPLRNSAQTWYKLLMIEKPGGEIEITLKAVEDAKHKYTIFSQTFASPEALDQLIPPSRHPADKPSQMDSFFDLLRNLRAEANLARPSPQSRKNPANPVSQRQL